MKSPANPFRAHSENSQNAQAFLRKLQIASALWEISDCANSLQAAASCFGHKGLKGGTTDIKIARRSSARVLYPRKVPGNAYGSSTMAACVCVCVKFSRRGSRFVSSWFSLCWPPPWGGLGLLVRVVPGY